MTFPTKMTSSGQYIPEEFLSYQNIADSFPAVFDEGKRTLWEVAGKIQIMRLETKIFPQLTVEENKEAIKRKAPEYTAIQEQVARFRSRLLSINGQIERAIFLCDAVPETDIRSFQFESSTTKVFDFCRQVLPKLKDWSIQGNLLAERFDLIMASDAKHYSESFRNFQSAITPSSGFLGHLTSKLSSLFSARAEASAVEDIATPLILDPKLLNVCVSLLAIDNNLLEKLSVQSYLQAFIAKIAPDESSKYQDYKPQIVFLKILLSRLHKQESFRNVESLEPETALLDFQNQISLSLAQYLQDVLPANISPFLEQVDFSGALSKIDGRLHGAKATSAALKGSLKQLVDTKLECYQKQVKDPLKTDLLNQLVILASKIK